MKHFGARLWVSRFRDLESGVLGFRDLRVYGAYRVRVFVRP